jgi:hypothetical protein
MKRLENGRFELTEEELIKLFEAEAELEALEYAGVDNWIGYDYRWDYLEEDGFETFREYAEDKVKKSLKLVYIV